MTRSICLTLLCTSLLSQLLVAQKTLSKIKLEEYTVQEGFLPIYYSEKSGKVLLKITNLDEELLYNSGLTSGLGSNDIGLDRGQLGGVKLVYWKRTGPRVMLLQRNTRYRAISNNPAEANSVQEAFAESVIGSFPIVDASNGIVIDITSLVVSDAHGTAARVEARKQGKFKLDKNKSAVISEQCLAFPDNVELEALLTFTGEAKGAWLRSVSPDSRSFAVRQHHSLIRLPDDGYQMRPYHIRSGYINIEYKDYAQPIDQSLEQRYITRHRLSPKNPSATKSEPIKPIIYYLDPGCPEPIRSALLEGASWWNEAYEAAGYKNAFQVKMLPADAHPLDVRYNIIQWVHRSTRGWSYGGSVIDPRTGEIIKGHVSLGSLRVRQDFLIAQGLKATYESDGSNTDPLVGMALARLRQLSAHEVGHTLGLVHNFAASSSARASVMDYPHPYVTQYRDGSIQLDSGVYAVGIGDWDKLAIKYGYIYAEDKDQVELLEDVIQDIDASGIPFISDRDARDPAGAHPDAHLWDNGDDILAELDRLRKVRKLALAALDEDHMSPDRPQSYLQQILVPIYFMMRYQEEAAVKLIGGYHYDYSMAGQGTITPVDQDRQREAISTLLQGLDPERLTLSRDLIKRLTPMPQGYRDGRELINGNTGPIMDVYAYAGAQTDHIYGLVLHPERLNRLQMQSEIYGQDFDLSALLDVMEAQDYDRDWSDYAGRIYHMQERQYVQQLIRVARDERTHTSVLTIVLNRLGTIRDRATIGRTTVNYFTIPLWREIELFLTEPTEYIPADRYEMPPGSPIGCGHEH